MEKSTLINVAALAIAGAIALYYIIKKQRKDSGYFGDKVHHSNKELLILEQYKQKYVAAPEDNRLPTIKKDGYTLEDIALLATGMIFTHPLPDDAAKAALKPGDLVKLKFIDCDNDVERMWVKVNGLHNGLFYGELQNNSTSIADLESGSNIWFHYNHIFEIGNKTK